MEPQAEQEIQITKTYKSKKLFIVLFLIIALVAAGAGGFFFGKQKNEAKSQQSVSTTDQTVDASAHDTDGPAVHFVQSVGYPFDLPNKKFTIQLGLPDAAQSVAISSSIPDPGYTSYLTDKFNDELGRFMIGNPKVPNATRDLSLIAIGKSWLGSTTAVPEPLEFEDVSTPAKKQQYINKLASAAAECVKDKRKGFETTDKLLRICYSLITGKDGWAPTLDIKGYGEISGIKVVVLGYIDLSDGRTLTETEDLKLRQNAQSGSIPESTQAAVDTFIAALAQTNIVVGPRP